MDEYGTRELWTDSPARRCPRSCWCVLPEHCFNLTPEEIETERQKRITAGWVEQQEHRDGFTVLSYKRGT